MTNTPATAPIEPAPDYPEHRKPAKMKDLSRACGDFIEWLETQGYCIAEPGLNGELFRVQASRDRLLADHFEIDRDALEREKLDMLRRIREGQGLPSTT